jgi:hypothetical protein
MPKLGGLTILMSEPRLYFMDVDGHRIQLTTEELQSQNLWQRVVMEQSTIMPPKIKEMDYQGKIAQMLRDATRLEAPEELTVRGQFKEILRQYCTSRIRAMEPAELKMGKPWTENGRTMFTMPGLEEFLRQRHFNYRSRAEIQEHLKAINGTENCHGIKNYYKEGDQRTSVRVWWVPAFEEDEVSLTVKEIENDVPF